MTIVPAATAITLLFLVTLALQEFGWRLGARRRRTNGPPEGVTAMEGAAFALLGLLMAFTFNGAASRFDDRRQLIVQEVNALGTAWLRLDLLPPATQPHARELFRGYVDQRIAGYQAMPDLAAARAHFDTATIRQGELWAAAVAATQQAGNTAVTTLVMMSLNESFDVASARLAAVEMHPPAMIWILLGVLTVICCMLAGFDMSVGTRRSGMHVLALALLLTVTLYVIVDFEFPRLGLIRVDSFDRLLVDLRAQMH